MQLLNPPPPTHTCDVCLCSLIWQYIRNLRSMFTSFLIVVWVFPTPPLVEFFLFNSLFIFVSPVFSIISCQSKIMKIHYFSEKERKEKREKKKRKKKRMLYVIQHLVYNPLHLYLPFNHCSVIKMLKCCLYLDSNNVDGHRSFPPFVSV